MLTSSSTPSIPILLCIEGRELGWSRAFRSGNCGPILDRTPGLSALDYAVRYIREAIIRGDSLRGSGCLAGATLCCDHRSGGGAPEGHAGSAAAARHRWKSDVRCASCCAGHREGRGTLLYRQRLRPFSEIALAESADLNLKQGRPEES